MDFYVCLERPGYRVGLFSDTPQFPIWSSQKRVLRYKGAGTCLRFRGRFVCIDWSHQTPHGASIFPSWRSSARTEFSENSENLLQVGRRRAPRGRVGTQHKVTKEDAIKWYARLLFCRLTSICLDWSSDHACQFPELISGVLYCSGVKCIMHLMLWFHVCCDCSLVSPHLLLSGLAVCIQAQGSFITSVVDGQCC